MQTCLSLSRHLVGAPSKAAEPPPRTSAPLHQRHHHRLMFSKILNWMLDSELIETQFKKQGGTPLQLIGIKNWQAFNHHTSSPP